jgi:hypothetical protein
MTCLGVLYAKFDAWDAEIRETLAPPENNLEAPMEEHDARAPDGAEACLQYMHPHSLPLLFRPTNSLRMPAKPVLCDTVAALPRTTLRKSVSVFLG